MMPTDWSFNPNHPHLSYYASRAEDPRALPELDTSLERIGEYQRRLWPNRQQNKARFPLAGYPAIAGVRRGGGVQPQPP